MASGAYVQTKPLVPQGSTAPRASGSERLMKSGDDKPSVARLAKSGPNQRDKPRRRFAPSDLVDHSPAAPTK